MVRCGHSLPEVLVAMTLLGVTLVPIAGTFHLGSDIAARSAARQDALLEGVAVLDSLRMAPGAGPGERGRPGGGVIRWSADTGPDGPIRARVTVLHADGRSRVSLEGVALQRLPAIPSPADTLPDGMGGSP